MIKINKIEGRIKIEMLAVEVGADLCVIISGGDTPHVGCVTLSIPRESLLDQTKISATTSILNLVGHKDDEIAKYVSHTLSSTLNKNVVTTAGIHLDNITKDEINVIMKMIKEMTKCMVHQILQNQNK